MKDSLKTTNKLLVVGKPGAGKSRFLLRILEAFNGYEKFVLIRSFFREDGINSLDVELQKLNSFVLIWDDLHRVKNENVNQTINQIEQLAKEYGMEYIFIGTSRMEGEYYQFKQEEIKLDDFRSLELIEKCSAYFGVSVDGGVKEKLLEVEDGTPFYVISLFATSKERGKKRLTEDDLKTLPNDSFAIWRDHLNFLESEGRLSTSEKNVLRSIALAMMAVRTMDFEVLENFYVQIFRGDLSEFDYALDEVVKKFFIGIEGELCSMHAVQAEVVEEKYPVEERKIDRLKDVITALERDKCLILLWAFAHWFHASEKHGDCLKFLDLFIEQEPNIAVAYSNRGNAYNGLSEHERAIEDYNKAVELNPNFAAAYGNRGIAHSKIGRYEESARDFKEAGILFFDSGSEEDTVKTFSFCFDLRAKSENEDVIYSGLALFLITLNPDVIIALRRMGIEDENLRKIHKLTLKKLQNEDIPEAIAAVEREDEREEMKILLELLKYF